MDCPGLAEATVILPRSTDDQFLHRKVCLDFINSRPLPLRSEFFLVARKSFQWLLRNDTSWFDLNFPKARWYIPAQASLF